MEIYVNGKQKVIENMTLAELLKDLDLEKRHCAVAVNTRLAPRVSWEKILLKTGDKIEVVHAVAGG